MRADWQVDIGATLFDLLNRIRKGGISCPG
jgi:hypothetical protein